jgi:hypothetical protein
MGINDYIALIVTREDKEGSGDAPAGRSDTYLGIVKIMKTVEIRSSGVTDRLVTLVNILETADPRSSKRQIPCPRRGGHGLALSRLGDGCKRLFLGPHGLNSELANRCDDLVHVSFRVRNTGKRDGAEIAQLYVTPVHPPVERPLKELKGFQKVYLKAASGPDQERIE